ncbi:trypsin-like cysteine/serine peptidase domain-containing protein [Limtongia smithiae]|uniref:trypsin-like cysteine/serine peptidase domain-containing protein n=1 Tax=Limtongia smithiae TaxID=1125753 RepID=UPI0034CE68D3
MDEGEVDDDTAEAIVTTVLGDSVEWQRTIERVVKSVVSIRFAQVTAFDWESALISEATGFVVDAVRGLIMTNRHVVGAGPFTGTAVFDNHEECDVFPLYRDPVHDFGILRFDPKSIRHMPVVSLELRPDLARVGLEIRVVGNDAGEKLSILAGFISRLDRNAPEYGLQSYSDFNTEYIQAAASASGGSSGSPVVNIDGYAVALQAGGATHASTDYFLPLHRGLRALRCIQNDEPITRGTIQVQWLLRPYDECRRLGLSPEIESQMREAFPDHIGLLVAFVVLPEGPSYGMVEEGDALIKVNDMYLSNFVKLDKILDASVNETVNIVIERRGKLMNFTIKVGDLHAITPDRYVEIGGSILHNLSYQAARLYCVPVKGVFVAQDSRSFAVGREKKGFILESINDEPTPDLDAFVKVMQTIRDDQWVVCSRRNIEDMHTVSTVVVRVDRHWTGPFQMAVRNDKTGLWDFTDLGTALPPKPIERQSALFEDMVDDSMNDSVKKLVRSFVRVTCTVPLVIDGFPNGEVSGEGIVVDAENGFIVVARCIVPYDLCDIVITIADSIMVPGKVVFLHPTQGYAIVSYDPSLVDAPVVAAVLSSELSQRGAAVTFMGTCATSSVLAVRTYVVDVTAVSVRASMEPPRYRTTLLESATVDSMLSQQCGCGIFVNADTGIVSALWLRLMDERGRSSSCQVGLPSSMLVGILGELQRGEKPSARFLDMDFGAARMDQARIRGVPEDWIRRIERENKEYRKLFYVKKVVCPPVGESTDSSSCGDALQTGDVILSVDENIVTRASELYELVRTKEIVKMEIVRQRKVLTLNVPTAGTDGLETDRVVVWCGAVLQRPHHAVRQQISKLHSGVYVSARQRGSPAAQYGIEGTYFITHVNGQATPDLDAFVQAVTAIPDRTYVMLRAVTFDDAPCACSIRLDLHYFPTFELVKDTTQIGVWRRFVYKDGQRVERVPGTNGEAAAPIRAVTEPVIEPAAESVNT